MRACMLSHVQPLAAPCTLACQAPLSMGFSRQEYWSGLPFPSPGDLVGPGIEPVSLESPAQADSLPLCHLGSPTVIFIVKTPQPTRPLELKSVLSKDQFELTEG